MSRIASSAVVPPRRSTASQPPQGSPTSNDNEQPPTLSWRALAALTARLQRISSKHRGKGGASPLAYGSSLPRETLLRMATRCSRAELLAEPGVGPMIMAEIEAWLAAHGRRLRPDPEDPRTALARAVAHLEAVLGGSPEAAFAAYTALPELRRTLRLHPPRTRPDQSKADAGRTGRGEHHRGTRRP